MAIPLLVDDADAAIKQLEEFLARLKALRKKQQEAEEREALKRRPIQMFEGMPPWAVPGGIGQGAQESWRGGTDAGLSGSWYAEYKKNDPAGFAELLRRLYRDARSRNDRVRFAALALLNHLKLAGLI